MNQNDIPQAIKNGKTVLGIEFGSTRIKAVLIGEDHAPIASGSYVLSIEAITFRAASQNRWMSGLSIASYFSRNAASSVLAAPSVTALLNRAVATSACTPGASDWRKRSTT